MNCDLFKLVNRELSGIDRHENATDWRKNLGSFLAANKNTYINLCCRHAKSNCHSCTGSWYQNSSIGFMNWSSAHHSKSYQKKYKWQKLKARSFPFILVLSKFILILSWFYLDFIQIFLKTHFIQISSG